MSFLSTHRGNILDRTTISKGLIEPGDIIEFRYKGSFKGVNCLSEGWEMKTGNNKIIIWSLAQTPLSEKLFNYIELNKYE